ncbi:DUF3515 family protein [Aeromicrobium terrae]|uniref:DUF3515 family protein n=1 Tax=Aeromicrobium terrae TaxID=2498846 RepID=UPI001E305064|nr:DUF3515 family protein [Aeromicrobium terrae]
MPRRLALTLATAAVVLAGCGTLDVDEYPTTKGTSVDCKALLADTPRTVAGQDARDVTDHVASAWGDPPIILRCGVEKPKALKPTSPCFPVRDVGWFAEKTPDGYLFTSIGRKYFVSVEVPKDYDPAADALADLAEVIGRHDPEVQACA